MVAAEGMILQYVFLALVKGVVREQLNGRGEVEWWYLEVTEWKEQ